MKKKLRVAIVVLVIAGLFGSFVGQMTTIPAYIQDPYYRALVGIEKANPGFDILATREYKNTIEVYLYPHAADQGVEKFLEDLFLFLDELMNEDIVEVRIFMCHKYNGRFYMNQLWRANNLADKLTIKSFGVDIQYRSIASMFPLVIPARPYYEGSPSILK